MADDSILPGTGDRVAADELSIGGQTVKVQRIKAGWGADGTWNETDQSAGKRFPTATVWGVSTYGTRTIANTATLIPSTTQTGRQKLFFRNIGSTTVYIGWDSSVTTSNGIPIGPNETFDEYVSHDVYGIVASGTCEIRYSEHK